MEWNGSLEWLMQLIEGWDNYDQLMHMVINSYLNQELQLLPNINSCNLLFVFKKHFLNFIK